LEKIQDAAPDNGALNGKVRNAEEFVLIFWVRNSMLGMVVRVFGRFADVILNFSELFCQTLVDLTCMQIGMHIYHHTPAHSHLDTHTHAHTPCFPQTLQAAVGLAESFDQVKAQGITRGRWA